jgi:CRISPR/Cas system-associated exonuclease Cas4 (RecB family)
MFSDCPFAFATKYELGIPEPPTDPLRTGQLMAMTIEKYLAHLVEGKIPTDITELPEIAKRVWSEHGAGLPIRVLDEVLRICGNYAASHILDFEHMVGVEVWLPRKGDVDLVLGGRRVVGKVDELYLYPDEQLAVVRDAKTNWSIWSEQEAREKLQARVYPVLVQHALPDVERVRMVFDFVRHGAERVVELTRDEIAEEVEKLAALIALMQRPGARPATPGARCSYCAYTQRCPTFKSMKRDLTSFTPAGPDEARAIAAETTVLEAALKQRKEALKVWADENGAIELNGVTWGHHLTESPRIDVRELAAFLEGRGLDPLDHPAIRVDTTELRKLVRKNGDLEQLIAWDSSTRFDVRKAKEGEE